MLRVASFETSTASSPIAMQKYEELSSLNSNDEMKKLLLIVSMSIAVSDIVTLGSEISSTTISFLNQSIVNLSVLVTAVQENSAESPTGRVTLLGPSVTNITVDQY